MRQGAGAVRCRYLPVRRGVFARAAALMLVLVLAWAAGAGPTAQARSSGRADRPIDVAVIYSHVKQDGVFNSLVGASVAQADSAGLIRLRQRIALADAEVEEVVDAFARRGVRHFLLVGSTYAGVTARLADRYPLLRFAIIDVVVDRPNVRSILFREEEGAYLAGMAAAHAAAGAPVAFLGGVPLEAVIRFGCGFVQGVRAVQPDSPVLTAWVSDRVDGFRDVERARQLARELLDQGAAVIFVSAGLAGRGALEEIAARGRLGIGVDTNQNGLFPGRVLTSVVKRVDVKLTAELLDLVNERDWTPGVRHGGLADGSIDWAVDEHNRHLVAPVLAQVEAARQALRDGRLTLPPAEEDPACRPLVEAAVP